MKKISLLILVITLASFATIAQDIKKESKATETKMEAFASKTGRITKFVDTKLPDLKLSYGEVAETRIRKLSSGAESRYFYQISKQGKYSDNTASIEYTDLLEVIKAIKTLKSDVEKDIALAPDYLENKFTTEDDFQIGYYINKGKSTWFLKLERFGSDNTVFVKEGSDIENVFLEAKAQIDVLKK